jgi:hypothetical protein
MRSVCADGPRRADCTACCFEAEEIERLGIRRALELSQTQPLANDSDSVKRTADTRRIVWIIDFISECAATIS